MTPATSTHAPPLRRFVEHTMGMPVSLAVRGAPRPGPVEGAWAEVMAELRCVDLVFSTWRPQSCVSRYARGEIALADCPPEVGEVIALAERAEAESNGAFSCYLPGPDGRRRFDPTGVVKGWAVDRAAAPLRRLERADFALSAGGDLVCRSTRPDAVPWRIGIEDPHDARRLIATVPIHSGAVATSGTAHRGAHLLDARTGRTPEGVASVTVVGSSLTWADIDATAAYAHGVDAARWLRGRPGRSGLVAWADGRSEVVGG